jgi:orotate phosphoribosyltransferase
MDDSEYTRDAFRSAGGIRQGHFLVRSGHHTAEFWEKFALFQQPALASDVLSRLAARLRNLESTHVAGPSQGGLIACFELARLLGLPAIFLEKTRRPERFIIQRGTRLGITDKVIVVDDLVSSGETLGAVIEVIRASGAKVVAAAAIIDRRNTIVNPLSIEFPVESLLALDGPPTWDAEVCPLCAAGIPLLHPRTMSPVVNADGDLWDNLRGASQI